MSDSHPELAAVVLTVRPQQTAILPSGLGRAAQSLLLSWIHDIDPALAQSLHDDCPVKPYTCSTLWGARSAGRGHIHVAPDQTYKLRLTTLTPELTARLREFLASPPATVELDRHPCVLESWTVDPGVEPIDREGPSRLSHQARRVAGHPDPLACVRLPGRLPA